MVRKKTRSYLIIAGFVLIAVGATLALCSRPVFTMTRYEAQEVTRSETIMNYTFNVNQLQDKLVPFQMNIGQKLDIFAAGSADFNFSIAKFTDPSHIAQPDQPDVTYLSMENITSVNTTWNTTVRSSQPGSYYLIFLARNASYSSPVQIMANVTKTWTDIQTYGVPYKAALIDSNFAYVGLGIGVFGAIVSAFFYPRHRFRKSNSTRNVKTRANFF